MPKPLVRKRAGFLAVTTLLCFSVTFAGDSASCTFSCDGEATPDSRIVPVHSRFFARQIQQGCMGPAQWTWSFGDGATATTTDATVYHYYFRPGTYIWTLTGTMDGATATDSGTISALPDPCKVEYSATAEPSSGLEPLPGKMVENGVRSRMLACLLFSIARESKTPWSIGGVQSGEATHLRACS